MRGENRRRRLLKGLSKTWVVQRLKQIDLSAVPSWFGPFVSTASRYQHSVGVGQLSFLVRGGTERDKLLLTAAAVLHDVGDGPFPHISDQSMKEILGFTHEGAVRFAFENSPVKDFLTLNKYGLDLEEVCFVLEGRHFISPLLYGFPDLDNADNIHRFMKTIPEKPLGEPSYSPSEIAPSMSLDLAEQRVHRDLQKRWSADYGKVYSYVWNNGPNMACWTMLGRALRILREELTPAFFRLTNREAYHVIRLRIPALANGLRKKEFKILIDREYTQLRGEAQRLAEPSNLAKVEEMLCRETGLEEWSVGLTVDRPTSCMGKADRWRVYLVSYKGSKEPVALLEDILSSSEPFINY